MATEGIDIWYEAVSDVLDALRYRVKDGEGKEDEDGLDVYVEECLSDPNAVKRKIMAL